MSHLPIGWGHITTVATSIKGCHALNAAPVLSEKMDHTGFSDGYLSQYVYDLDTTMCATSWLELVQSTIIVRSSPTQQRPFV